jgi:hypothetical protein
MPSLSISRKVTLVREMVQANLTVEALKEMEKEIMAMSPHQEDCVIASMIVC